MKMFLGVLAFVLLAPPGLRTAAAASADDFHTPGPAYPEQARQAHVTGSGLCRVVFSTSGSVSEAVMLKSTGSALLDQNTLDWARQHWTGKPGTQLRVPIVYKISPAARLPPGAYHTPLPPYSHLAMTHNLTGEGHYQATFGANGHAASVVTVKSSGSGILDSRMTEWATLYWTGPPNTKLDFSVNHVIR